MTPLNPPSPTTPYATFASVAGEPLLSLPESELIDAYKAYGAVLLRGFDVDLAAFRALTHRLCAGSVFNESPGREVIDRDQNIQTVNLGVEAFPLHPELSREPWRPDICFFWCIQPPTTGGETTVCDGVEIVRRLPRAVYDEFASRKLRYQKIATPAECRFWLGSSEPDDATLSKPPEGCPYAFDRIAGQILRSYITPALYKPMFSDDLSFGNFLMFGRYVNRIRAFPTFENGELVSDALLDQVKAVSDQLETPVSWRAGDVLVLDNSRFMHGRRAVTDVTERRIATYFGYIRFADLDAAERNAPWRNSSFRPPGA